MKGGKKGRPPKAGGTRKSSKPKPAPGKRAPGAPPPKGSRKRPDYGGASSQSDV